MAVKVSASIAEQVFIFRADSLFAGRKPVEPALTQFVGRAEPRLVHQLLIVIGLFGRLLCRHGRIVALAGRDRLQIRLAQLPGNLPARLVQADPGIFQSQGGLAYLNLLAGIEDGDFQFESQRPPAVVTA